MNSDKQKFNPLGEDNKVKEKIPFKQKDIVLQTKKKKEKESIFKRIWKYLWDDLDKGEQKEEGGQKENKKKLAIAKKQQELEAKARQKAQKEIKKANKRLLAEQKKQKKKEKVVEETGSFVNNFFQVKKEKKQGEDKKSALEAGLLHKIIADQETIIKPKLENKEQIKLVQEDKRLEKKLENKVKQTKQSWLSNFWQKLFSSSSKKKQKKFQEKKAEEERKVRQKLDQQKQKKVLAKQKKAKINLLQKEKQLEKQPKKKKQSWFKNIFQPKVKDKTKKTEVKKSEKKKKLRAELKTLIKEAEEKKQAKETAQNNFHSEEIDKLNILPPQAKKEISHFNADAEQTPFERHKTKMAKLFAAQQEKYSNLKIRESIENKYWHAHNIVRANLIKDQETLFFNWQNKILTLVLGTGLAILTIGILYGGLLVWESNKLKQNQYIFANLDNVNEQIKKEEIDVEKILKFNNKLVLVDFILDNHIYWSNFFKFLERYTIFNVYYEGFSGDISGKYTIPAVAKDYRSVYLQIKLLQQSNDVLSANTKSAQALREQIKQKEKESKDSTKKKEKQAEKIKFILDLILDRKKIFLK